MKKLSEQLAEEFTSTLSGFANHKDPLVFGRALINNFLIFVKERDAYIIGEDENESIGQSPYMGTNWAALERNNLKAKQHKRAEETL